MPVRIGDDGEGERCLGDVVDVGDPAVMGGEVVGGLRCGKSTCQLLQLTSSLVQLFAYCASRSWNSSYKSNYLHSTFLKLPLQFRECAKLRRADRRKVRRMAEEDGPFPSQPFVEIDFALCCFCFEIGCYTSEANARLLFG